MKISADIYKSISMNNPRQTKYDNAEVLHISRRGNIKRTEIEASREQAIFDFVGEERVYGVFASLHPAPRHVSDILKDVIGKLDIHENDPLANLRDTWGDLLGHDIAQVSAPLFLKDNVLTIGVNNPSWKFVMEKQLAGKIMPLIKQALKNDSLNSLKFIIKE